MPKRCPSALSLGSRVPAPTHGTLQSWRSCFDAEIKRTAGTVGEGRWCWCLGNQHEHRLTWLLLSLPNHITSTNITELLNNVQHGSHSYCPFSLFFIPSKLYYLTSFCEAFPNSLCNCVILLASCALFFHTALFSRFSYFSFCSTMCSPIIYFLFLLFLCLQQRFLLFTFSKPTGRRAGILLPESWSSETSEKLMVTTIAVQIPSDEFYWQCHGSVERK